MTEKIVLVVFRELSEHLRPCYVCRHEGDVVLFVDPWADRYDLLRCWRDNLDDLELDWLREALQWPDGMVPAAWLEEVGPMAVPECLWPCVDAEQD